MIDNKDKEYIDLSIKELFNAFRTEIEFTKTELNAKFAEFSSKIYNFYSLLNGQIENINSETTNYKNLNNELTKEIDKLFLIPDKIQNRIANITPDLSIELKKIYDNKSDEIADKYEASSNALISQISIQKQEVGNIISKLNDSFELIYSRNKKKILGYISVVVLISSFVSGITTYLITHYLPTRVNVTGISSLEVRDSNVHVSGGTIRKENPKTEFRN